MNIVRACKRLVLVSRPGFWAPIAAIYAGGVVVAGQHWGWPVLLGLFFCTIPLGLILYGINDITDREADAISKRKASGALGVRVSAADTRLFIWSGVFMTVLFVTIFAFTRHYLSAIGVLVLALVSVTYSVPPLRFKVRPVLDALDHVIGAFAVFLMGCFAAVTGLEARLPSPLLLSVLACYTVAMYGIAALVDYDTDKKVGDRTLAVFLGMRATLVWSALFFAACTVLVWRHNYAVAAYFAVCMASAAACALLPLKKIIGALRVVVWFIILSVPLVAVYVLVFGY